MMAHRARRAAIASLSVLILGFSAVAAAHGEHVLHRPRAESTTTIVGRLGGGVASMLFNRSHLTVTTASGPITVNIMANTVITVEGRLTGAELNAGSAPVYVRARGVERSGSLTASRVAVSINVNRWTAHRARTVKRHGALWSGR